MTIDAEVDALLAEEAQQRRAQLTAQVQERRERERQAQAVQATLDALEERLRQFDAAALAKLRRQAEATLQAYTAGMAAWNDQLENISDELTALGSQLPASVQHGGYDIGGGVCIGDVTVRRQRLQAEVSELAKAAIVSHIGRAQWSLDSPKD